MCDYMKPTMSNNKKRLTILVVAASIAATVGLASSYFLGPDNPVEQTAESVLNTTTDQAFGLKPGTTNIDLSKEK